MRLPKLSSYSSMPRLRTRPIRIGLVHLRRDRDDSGPDRRLHNGRLYRAVHSGPQQGTELLASAGDARNLQRSASGSRSHSSVAVSRRGRQNKIKPPRACPAEQCLSTARRLRSRNACALDRSLDAHAKARLGTKQERNRQLVRSLAEESRRMMRRISLAGRGGRLRCFNLRLWRPGMVSRGRRAPGRCPDRLRVLRFLRRVVAALPGLTIADRKLCDRGPGRPRFSSRRAPGPSARR